jgi:polyhydroxyalkanoate synthesis repressor PhaR
MAASGSGEDVVIIKKYANRRLYDTESSSYITLERLAEMVRQKRQFKVVDAKSGEDITRSVLAQIIMDEESRGAEMLPVNFLRQLIGMYGGQMQGMVPQYLEASLDALQRNQSQFREAVAGAFAANPFAEMARRNMEMFQSAAGGAASRAQAGAGAGAGAGSGTAGPAEAGGRDDEIERLRSELAALQAKVDKLAK